MEIQEINYFDIPNYNLFIERRGIMLTSVEFFSFLKEKLLDRFEKINDNCFCINKINLIIVKEYFLKRGECLYIDENGERKLGYNGEYIKY